MECSINRGIFAARIIALILLMIYAYMDKWTRKVGGKLSPLLIPRVLTVFVNGFLVFKGALSGKMEFSYNR